ncbi:MAG: benzoate-CoA ligase family protein [Acidobacteriota bacterium]
MGIDIPDELNLATYFLDQRLLDGLGHRPAIRTEDRNWSYKEIAGLSCRCARVLANAGVWPEERVVIALPDGAPFVGALFGILRHGSVAVMVNPDLPAEMIAYFLDYTRARAAFVDRAYVDVFEAVGASLATSPTLFDLGDARLKHELAVASSEYATFPSHPDDAAIWLFSGGTTGQPKAVIQTNRSFVNTTELYGRALLGLQASDITLSVPKLYFGYALGSNLLFPFSVGASCALFSEHSTADSVFAQIERHRPTVLITVPTMIRHMVSHPAARQRDLTSLRLATSAGEALPVELHRRWLETFGTELLDGLGTAEMWHIFLSNRPGSVVPGTLGQAVDGFDVKLCDEDGREVPEGEVGTLWVRGDSRAIGYWHRHEDTCRAFQGEWYVSGDMLRRNPDGTFVYCGRADDMLKVSGKWLSPGELENCLLQHVSVKEVAVVGVKTADGLIKPHAFVVSDHPSPELAEALQVFAKSRLEPYKYPRAVVFVDALPRTHLGKVDRHALATAARTDE